MTGMNIQMKHMISLFSSTFYDNLVLVSILLTMIYSLNYFVTCYGEIFLPFFFISTENKTSGFLQIVCYLKEFIYRNGNVNEVISAEVTITQSI